MFLRSLPALGSVIAVHIGTIGRRAGVPTDAEQWGWRCGIPSGSLRGICTEGTAPDFAEARSQFEAAWRKLRPNYTDADFTDYRRARLDGMEANNVGDGLQASDPNPGRPLTVLLRCGD
jgi:hypothetical protein